LKQAISPVVAGVVIVLVVVIAGFLIWRGTSGGAGNLPPGAVGNPGPFAPGGAAVGQGGMPEQARQRGQGGGPPFFGAPTGTGTPGAPPGNPGGATGQ